MTTKVVKYNGSWTVEVNQGNQYFHLDIVSPRTKKEANWHKKMFDKAIENFEKEIKNT